MGTILSAVLLVIAVIDSWRFIPAFLAAAVALALCAAWVSSLGSVHMGARVFILLPLAAFAAALAIFKLRGKKAVRIPARGRIALVCLAVLLFGIQAVESNRRELAGMAVEWGIANNSPWAVASAQQLYKTGAAREQTERILARYGLTEEALTLLRAFSNVNRSIWKMVLEYPASADRLHFLSALAGMGISAPDTKIFIRLMDEGDQDAADILYPLIPYPDTMMVMARRPDLLQDVLRRGVPEQYDGSAQQPALLLAASLEPEYTRILLDAGYDPNVDKRYKSTPPLVRAVVDKPQNRGVAEMLLVAGASPNRVDSWQGLSPLHAAAAKGRDDIVDALLSAGAEVNLRDRDGRTPLHCAAIFGNVHAVARLLSSGASPSFQDSDGMAPLHWAALFGHERICALLVEAGAALEQQDKEGFTPLLLAAYLGGGPVVAAMAEHSPPGLQEMANAPDNWGTTPLKLAVKQSYQWSRSLEDAAKMGISREALGFPKGPGKREDESPVAGVWQNWLNRKAASVRVLLRAGADPGPRVRKNATILHVAFDGDLRIDRGRQVNPKWSWQWDWRANRNTPLEYVWMDMDTVYPQALEALLRAGASVPAREEIAEECSRAPSYLFEKYMRDKCIQVMETFAQRETASDK